MKSMKSVLLIVGCLLLGAFLFGYRPSSATTENSAEKTEQSKISVNGTADVLVAPDEVVITIGIDTRNKNIVTAKTENDAKVKEILNVAKKFNVDTKNIQVDYIDIRPGDITVKPSFEVYGATDPAKVGYVVRKKIVVTMKDLSKYEDFITEVVKKGAEYVQKVEFKSSQLRAHKDKARELAIKAAKEKAESMTAAIGQKAGKAVSIREEQEYYWSWYDSWYSGWYGGGMVSAANNVQNVVSSNQPADGEGVVPGQIKIRASVNADFLLQ